MVPDFIHQALVQGLGLLIRGLGIWLKNMSPFVATALFGNAILLRLHPALNQNSEDDFAESSGLDTFWSLCRTLIAAYARKTKDGNVLATCI